MSVYGGFSTRAHEESYGKLTSQLIRLCQARITSNIDDKTMSNHFTTIYKSMKMLEKGKY